MTELQLTWRPSRLQRRLTTVAVLALLGAITLGRPQLVVLATPAVWALVVGRLRRPPDTLGVEVNCDRTRCFESEAVTIDTTVSLDGRADHITMLLRPSPGITATSGGAAVVTGADTSELTARWTPRAARWGRRSLGLTTVRLHAAGGLLTAEARLRLPDVAAFPRLPEQVASATPERLPDRIGEHVSRVAGHGVEFAGIGPYAPGDPPRRVNWPVTLRRGDLYVNRFAAERSADLVVMVDAFDDVGPPGASNLDLSVRGAAGLTRAHLRRHDRVGLVTVAGVLHWLAPDVSQRQYYRIAEQVMEAGHIESVVQPDLGRLPRTALPPWVTVVLFTPLLDPRVIEVIRDLRERGHPLTVIDVLTTEPTPATVTGTGSLALRLWRLDRLALRRELTGLGVAIEHWDGDQPLATPLSASARRPALDGRA